MINSSSSPERWSLTLALRAVHIDALLLFALLVLLGTGLMVLFSAGDQNTSLVVRQLIRMGTAFLVLFLLANIHPDRMRDLAYWIYGIGLILLIAVLMVGDEGKGAQRWLNLGIVRFQPSELMKIAVPLLVAAYIAERPLPPSFLRIVVCLVMVFIPSLLISKQPDLGTSLLIASAGLIVIFLSGISWRFIIGLLISVVGGLIANYIGK